MDRSVPLIQSTTRRRSLLRRTHSRLEMLYSDMYELLNFPTGISTLTKTKVTVGKWQFEFQLHFFGSPVAQIFELSKILTLGGLGRLHHNFRGQGSDDMLFFPAEQWLVR